MSWKVVYSAQALNDLSAIYEYIAFELLVPDTAANQVQRIMKSIKTLDEMPMRHKIYEEEPWQSQKLRIFPVDNYLVLYLLKEELNTVNIVRIIYGGRDVTGQLEETKTIDFKQKMLIISKSP